MDGIMAEDLEEDFEEGEEGEAPSSEGGGGGEATYVAEWVVADPARCVVEAVEEVVVGGGATATDEGHH